MLCNWPIYLDCFKLFFIPMLNFSYKWEILLMILVKTIDKNRKTYIITNCKEDGCKIMLIMAEIGDYMFSWLVMNIDLDHNNDVSCNRF